MGARRATRDSLPFQGAFIASYGVTNFTTRFASRRLPSLPTWGAASSGVEVASACWEAAYSGESSKRVIHIDRDLTVCAGSHQLKQCTHGVSFSLVQWIGNYNPWKIRLHRWRKKCRPTSPKVGLNFRRLYLHNHLEFEAPVKIWLVNAATFNATEPTCVGLEGTNYIYVDLLFCFFRKATIVIVV